MKAFVRVIALILASAMAHASEIHFPIDKQIDRFFPLLDNMDRVTKYLQNYGDIDQKITYLDGSGARETLTDLENILRLYKEDKRYEALKPFYKKAKKFEDLISHLRDLRSFSDDAKYSGNAATAKKYQDLLDEGRADYKKFLEKSGWADGSFSSDLRKTLKAINWPDLYADRDMLLTQMANNIGELQTKKYDVSKVEEGIHELKRDVRRISYFDHAASNILTSDGNIGCPLGKPVQKLRINDYGAYRCHIPDCLMSKLSNAQYQLDSLKMTGIRYELKGQDVPGSVTQSAQNILDDLKNSKVFLYIEAQLRSCRSSEDGEK
jgi:hypothetical protein